MTSSRWAVKALALNQTAQPCGVDTLVPWFIVEGRLYLVKLTGTFESGEEATLSHSFDGYREFTVKREDLREQVSVEEIERREQVIDPMGCVPDIAYGHLNPAWKKFLNALQPEEQLWTFNSIWKAWGQDELRSGYVVIKGEEIVPSGVQSS